MENKHRFAYLKIMSALLVFISLMAFVMKFNNEVPRALAWIYKWGETQGSIICIFLLVGGWIGYRFADRKQKQ